MSMENAILELAAAIRHLADSNREIAATGAEPLITREDTALETAVTKVEADAKAKTLQEKVMAKVEADRKPATTAKEAIAQALEIAKAEKEAATKKESSTATQSAQSAGDGPDSDDDPLADSTPLEYEKDVKPKLVQVGKNKQEMVDLLASFGVGKDLTYAKADQLPADKFGAVVAACDKILAARG